MQHIVSFDITADLPSNIILGQNTRPLTSYEKSFSAQSMITHLSPETQ